LKKGSVNTRYLSEGDILKVRMLITGEQKTEWPSLRAKIRAWGEKNGYDIHTTQPVLLDSIRGHVGKKRKHQKQTDEQLMQTYAKSRSIDTTTLKAGLTIMRKV
jgi:hypothetical protein